MYNIIVAERLLYCHTLTNKQMSAISLVTLATNERLVIEMFTTSFIRRSLTGAAVFAISILLLASTGCKQSKDTDVSKIKQPTTMGVSTSCTTSTMTSTTTSSTTSSMTTSMTTTVAMMTTTEPMTQKIVSESTAQIEPELATAWVEPNPLELTYSDLPISDYERILLCNVVAREYGSDWVSIYDKACVVACVMNRVNSPQFPGTIEGVLTQPNQFSGYYACNYEWSNVTDSVRESVDYYFNHQDEFGNYLYFYGDGTRNYFY